MTRRRYTSEMKAKAVMETLREEKHISEIATDYGVAPNQLRNWKKEFIEKMPSIFDESKERAEIRNKEKAMNYEREALYRQIGQVTFERDFLKKKGVDTWGTEFLDGFPGRL